MRKLLEWILTQETSTSRSSDEDCFHSRLKHFLSLWVSWRRVKSVFLGECLVFLSLAFLSLTLTSQPFPSTSSSILSFFLNPFLDCRCCLSWQEADRGRLFSSASSCLHRTCNINLSEPLAIIVIIILPSFFPSSSLSSLHPESLSLCVYNQCSLSSSPSSSCFSLPLFSSSSSKKH